MATVQAFVRLDPDRAPEQDAFLRSRTTVLREAGGQAWVALDEAQVASLVAQGLQVSVLDDAGLMQVGPVAWRPLDETPQPPPALRAAAPQGDDPADWWLRTVAPADKDWLVALHDLGAVALHTLDASSGVWRMSAAQAEAARALPFVAALGLFHPAYVVSLALAGLDEPLTAQTLSTLIVTLAPPADGGNLSLRCFDALSAADLVPALEAAGATVLQAGAQDLLLNVPPAAAAAVLSVPGLWTAAAPLSRRATAFRAGIIVGTNQVRHRGVVDFSVNLDGTGEVVGVIDSGCDAGTLAGLPVDLRANVRVMRHLDPTQPPGTAIPDAFLEPPSPTLHFHGTHVVGIVCADGTGFPGSPPAPPPGAPQPITGMATAAALVVQGPLPGVDTDGPFNFAVRQGASIINNSWGTSAGAGQANRYLANQAQPMDRWCWLNPDVLLVFAAGNDETDANHDGVLDNIGMSLEVVAKNMLTVGASENLRFDGGYNGAWGPAFGGNRFNAIPGANGAGTGPGGLFMISDNPAQVALFSGRGTVRTAAGASTGRIKPDLAAPGTNILSLRSSLAAPAGGSAANVPPTVPAVAYALLHGTSMAAPVVTGNAALLRQYLRTRHGQVRRPLLLEGVPLPPATDPQPLFSSRPALARHPDGLLCAWVTPALAAAARHIVARRVARHPGVAGAAPLDAAPVELAAAVGEHAALALAVVGERSYLLYRHADGKMRLAGFDRALAPLAGFGTAGVVTLSPDARPDDGAPPSLRALTLGGVDQLACAWPTTASGNTGGFFQRFRADTGAAVDPAAISLLFHQSTGPQQSLVWNAKVLAQCGVLHGASWQLQLRQADDSGAPLGAGPLTLLDQAAEVRDPALVWDPRSGRYAIVWCDARTVPGGALWLQFLDGDGAAQGSAQVVVTPPAAAHLRRPQILCHPAGGYLLAWEDDAQDGHFDVYLTLLGHDGLPDGRVPVDAGAGNRPVLRLSDTPGDTQGYALVADAEGVAVVYQNPDEVNADRVGVYLLTLTPALAFEAQRNPATPWLRSGRWDSAELLRHDSPGLSHVSAVWTGASWDLLRLAPAEGGANLQQWLRLNSDGAPDPHHGVDGVRERRFFGVALTLEMLWTGNDRRISAVNDALAGLSVHLDDADGAPVAAFGANGIAVVADDAGIDGSVVPQLGFFTLPAFTVVVAYAVNVAGALQLRLQRLDNRGRRMAPPVTLVAADGVAPHQWWMFVNGEAQSVAVYHRTVGADMQVFVRRFDVGGAPKAAEQALSAAGGQARDAVIARRPVAVNSSQREYAAAWQFRSHAAGAHWEIRFSRLGRTAQPLAHPPVANALQSTADITVIGPASPGWSATRDALAPQLVSTLTHAPWTVVPPPPPPPPPPAPATPPDWSPSWGLAWIGEEADGTRRLYFTALDENGQRLDVPQPPPYPKPAPPANGLSAPGPAPILALGTPGARVRDFRLAWNGRVFLLTWTEELAGALSHQATLVNRHAGQEAFALPSAALLRAVLVGGATNLAAAALPAAPASPPHLPSGQGWGLLNLRQCLSPALPVSFELRDDCALGPGRSTRYRFALPAGTALLRVTLTWTDPPGAGLVNRLHLTVRVGGQEFRGNLWETALGRSHLSRPIPQPPVAADAHEDIQAYKQVVLANPPAGDVEVIVAAAAFPADPFNQQNLQPFALVFAGTGPEAAFAPPPSALVDAAVY